MKRRAKSPIATADYAFRKLTAQERHTMVVKNFESVGGRDGNRHGTVLARSAKVNRWMEASGLRSAIRS